MFQQPITQIRTVPPLNSQQIGGTVRLWLDSLEPFPAKLVEKRNLYVSGLGDFPCWVWVEMTYGPFGQLIELPDGRNGDNQSNPAFEVNSNQALVGDIVWLRPGWNSDDYGQEWLFGWRCGAIASSQSDLFSPPDAPLGLSFVDSGTSCLLLPGNELPHPTTNYWDTETLGTNLLSCPESLAGIARITLLWTGAGWSAQVEPLGEDGFPTGEFLPMDVEVIDESPLELRLHLPDGLCCSGYFLITE